MFKIQDILSEKFSEYPEETQEFMKKYNEIIRENLKNELINDVAERMLKDIDRSKDNLMSILNDILENGCKGLKDMSTRTLLNMYLERKNEEDFIRLLEKVNDEMEK